MNSINQAGLIPIVAVLAAGLFCIYRFFTETRARRMARLTDDAKHRTPSIDIGNDPHNLGRMMESTGRNIGAKLSAGGTDNGGGGGGCGDGGSGE